jgi:hypothetical protein
MSASPRFLTALRNHCAGIRARAEQLDKLSQAFGLTGNDAMADLLGSLEYGLRKSSDDIMRVYDEELSEVIKAD